MSKTMTGATGSPNPDLKAYGLKWKQAIKLNEEGARLWARARELGREEAVLTEEIRTLSTAHMNARAAALRNGGPEPTRGAIEATQARLEAVGEDLRVTRQAMGESHAELLKTVAANRDEWGAEVQAAGVIALEKARVAADALSAHLQEAAELGSVFEWVESGGERFAMDRGPAVTIDALLGQQRRALGIDSVEMVA